MPSLCEKLLSHWSHLIGFSLPLMINKSTLTSQIIITFITFKRFLSIVCFLMNYRIMFIWKTFITIITYKRLLITMDFLMSEKTIFLDRTFMTLMTLKGFSSLCVLWYLRRLIWWAKHCIHFKDFSSLFSNES